MSSVLAEAAARVAAVQARGQHVARSAEPGSSEVDNHAVASAFEVIDDTRGGERLPDELASRLTRELGVDLSQVRIHRDERAARIAAQVGARALTVRSDIYFAAGAYDPTTAAGIELIAHEVMHVAQNARGAIVLGGRAVSRPDDPHEHQAVSFASQFISARRPPRPSAAGELVPAATTRGGGSDRGDRIDRAPAQGGTDEMWQQMFQGKSVVVGKLAHVSAPKGIILKAQPAPHARPVSAIIDFDKEVFLVRTTTESDVAKRWAFVTTTGSGISGFIEEKFLALDPPEPRASLYIVQSRERLGKIASDKFGADIVGGNDARLYVQAIYELNKGRPGIWLEEVHLSRWDTLPRKEAEEETLKVYLAIHITANRAIWIPSKEFVQQLKASGKITSGSTEIMRFARAAKDVAVGVLHGAEFLAGVVVGILEGAWQALVDIFKGAWELVKMAFEVMKAYLTGTLLELILETAKKVKDFFERLDVKQLVKSLGAYIAERWTSAGWFGKGEFVGQIVGYIALNVLLLVATEGGSVGVLLAKAAESGSDLARAVRALIKVLDVAQNPLKLLEDAGKGVTVSEEIAAKLKQGLARDGAVARDVEHGVQDAKNAAEHRVGKPQPEPKGHAPGKDLPPELSGLSRAKQVQRLMDEIERGAGGLRRPALNTLDPAEIERLRAEFASLGGDPNILRFNKGAQTGFVDQTGHINVRGDVNPVEGAHHPRSAMSSKAVLGHELGHRAHQGTKLPIGAWNDEFRASYWAAKNLPNLSDEERIHLILDAMERAREAGVSFKPNALMRKILYGY